MALHCRTRSADEIVGFLADEMASSGKRHAPSFQGRTEPSHPDHSHTHPTTSCEMGEMGCVDDSCLEHTHECAAPFQLMDDGEALLSNSFAHSHPSETELRQLLDQM